MINKDSRIFVAGHRGMVGSAVVRALQRKGYEDLLLRTSKDLDLTRQDQVNAFFDKYKPDAVVLAAARVGGIMANDTYPYQFIRENLAIQEHVIHAASRQKVPKLVFLGSSCIYPKHAEQPMKEEYLLSGYLEPTNQWYAIAKIAGVKMCEALRKQYGLDYISLMPTNLYGPNDNFDLETSHVLPALIRKFHEATQQGGPVSLWGSGKPLREFLHVDDLAEAVVFSLENQLNLSMYNVGTGEDLSIKKLAHKIAGVVGYEGGIEWDESKPDGTPRKLLDISKIREEGWSPTIDLDEGLRRTYEWYKEHENEIKELKID